jgi:hypothetical protein
VNTPILESKDVPVHRFKVVDVPLPTNVYQTPGAVFKVVTQVGTASTAAPTVVPVTDPAQAIGRAPVQRSLDGAGTLQLVH